MKRAIALVLLAGLFVGHCAHGATAIATVAANVTSWTDTTPGALRWCYAATAFNSAGNDSALSNFDCGEAKASPYTLTVRWVPPTKNADGTPLTDLAGFHIFRVAPPTSLGKPIQLSWSPSVTTQP